MAGFVDTKDGSRVVVEVPGSFSMRSWSRYTIQEEDVRDSHTAEQGQRLYFVEQNRVECTWGLTKVIKKEHEQAHRIIHRAFVEMLAEDGSGNGAE